MSDFHTAREFAQFIKGLGFRAFVAGVPGGDGPRGYGFITDDKGERVLSFSMDRGGLSGNYGPPTRESGTGWQLPGDVWSLKTADDVRAALYAHAPSEYAKGSATCSLCGSTRHGRGGFEYYSTVDQYLGQYGSSSKFQEI